MASLEQMLDIINRKQWIPIYGVYQIIHDNLKGKPALNDLRDYYGRLHPLRYFGSAVYHGITISQVSIPIIATIEKLFK